MAIGVTGLTAHTQVGGGTWQNYGTGGGSTLTTSAFLSSTSGQGRKFSGIKGMAFQVNASGTDLSNSLILVRFLLNGGFAATLAGDGGVIRLEDTSGNTSDWSVTGSDYYSSGWQEVIIDTSLTETTNSGTAANLALIQYAGMVVNANGGSGGDPNFIIDEVLSLPNTGLTLTGSTTNVFDELADWDETSLYGVIQRRSGKIFSKCPLILSPDAAATHASTDESITFEEPVYDDGTNVDSALSLQGLSSTDADTISLTRLNAVCFDNPDITGVNADKELDFTSASDVTADTCTFRGFDGTTVHLGGTGNSFDGSTFDTCSPITSTGATLNQGILRNSTAAAGEAALIWDANLDPDGDLDDLSVTKGAAAHHALRFTTTAPTSVTLRGWVTSGFSATDGNNDSTFEILHASPNNVTINVVGGTGNFTCEESGTATCTVVIDPVALTVTVTDQTTTDLLEKVRVLVWCVAGATTAFPSEDEVTAVVSGTTVTVTHTAHGLATNDQVRIEATGRKNLNGIHTITVTGVNAYTYTLPSADARVETATGQVTSPASTSKVYYDLGFRPAGMRIRAIEATGETLHDGAVHMEGYSDGVKQFVMGVRRHGTTTGGTRQINDALFIELQEHASTVDQVEATVEFDDEGFWIDWTLTASGYIFQYEAFGGFGVKAHVGSISMNNASVAEYDEMDFAFDLMFGCNILNSVSTSNPRFGSGVCDGDLNQYGWAAHWGNFGGTTSQYRTWTDNGMFVGQDQTTTFAVYKVTEVTLTGFKMEKDSGTNNTIPMYFLALQMPNTVVGTTTKSTGGAPATQTLPSFGFTPQMYGLLTAAVTTETSTQDVSITEGIYDGTNQGTLATSSDDGANDSQSIQNDNEILHVLSNTGTSLAQAVAQAITDDTPDIIWNPNDANAYNIGYWAIGVDDVREVESSLVLIDGYTNASGVISDTRTYSADQNVAGYARKGTSSPVYVTGNIAGTVDSANGLPVNVGLVRDE